VRNDRASASNPAVLTVITCLWLPGQIWNQLRERVSDTAALPGGGLRMLLQSFDRHRSLVAASVPVVALVGRRLTLVDRLTRNELAQQRHLALMHRLPVVE
jgi:hypothetical protein